MPPRRTARELTALAVLLAGMVFMAPAPRANPIAIENALPGSTAWRLTRPISHTRKPDSCSTTLGRPEIEGYASATSVAAGDSLAIYVNSAEPGYTIRVFRIG